MGKPAARVGDLHTCPMVTPGVPPIPHVGGPILPPGCPTVLIGGQPAARMGDMAVCVGPPDSIVMGSPTVLIGGQPAARMGDPTAHGGAIVLGLPTVLIGESGGGGGGGAGGGGGGGGSGAGGGSSSGSQAAGPAAGAAAAGTATPASGPSGKAEARAAIDRMNLPPAQAESAKRAVGHATTQSTIEVAGGKGGDVIVNISRPGFDGHQVMEYTVSRDGRKTVVQKAFNKEGTLVHHDPKT